jgi:hypothetical protein
MFVCRETYPEQPRVFAYRHFCRKLHALAASKRGLGFHPLSLTPCHFHPPEPRILVSGSDQSRLTG